MHRTKEAEWGREAQPGGGPSRCCPHSSCHHCHSSCHHFATLNYVTFETMLDQYFCHGPSACSLTSWILNLLITIWKQSIGSYHIAQLQPCETDISFYVCHNVQRLVTRVQLLVFSWDVVCDSVAFYSVTATQHIAWHHKEFSKCLSTGKKLQLLEAHLWPRDPFSLLVIVGSKEKLEQDRKEGKLAACQIQEAVRWRFSQNFPRAIQLSLSKQKRWSCHQ